MPSKAVLFGPLPPPAGGVATFVASLGRNLDAMGLAYEVRAYLGTPPAGVVRVDAGAPSVLRCFADLGRRDVCLDSSGLLVEYPAVRAARVWLALHRLRRFRWVKVLHDGTLPERWDGLEPERRHVAVAALRAADTLVAVDDDLVDWLWDVHGIASNVRRITSLLPVLDADGSDVPATLADLRSGGATVVSSVGAFLPNYGFATIAAAVEALRREHRAELELVLVESAFSRDEAYAASVTRGRPWVTVLRDIPHGQLMGVLRSSDAFVRATRKESYGLAKVEAVLVGTPVLATPVGETRGAVLFRDEAELIERLRPIVAGEHVPADDGWPAVFRREAEANMSALVELLRPWP